MNDQIQLSRRLGEMAPPVWKSRTQAKYCVVAEALREAIVGSAPGTKLPTIRELARVFGVTVVPVVRALRELRVEGLVVLRQGAGCWVAPQRQAPRSLFGMGGRQTTQLRCKVQSQSPHQMAYWEEAARAFAKVYPGTSVTFVPMDGGAAPDGSEADLVEISTLQYTDAQESGSFLNEPADGGGPPRLLFVPHMSHLGCAFYNPLLLKKLKVPAPDYEDFEGEMRWLLDLQARWKKVTGSDRPLINYHEPYMLLGAKSRRSMAEWIKGGEEALPPGLAQQLGRIHALLDLSLMKKDELDNSVPASQVLFSKGEIPVVFAHTSGLIDTFRGDGFEPSCHPCFDMDGEIVNVQTGFVIRSDHGRAVDALRFAEFLKKPEMQQKLTEHAMVPLRADLFHAGDAPSLWSKNRTVWFHTSEEKCIWQSIVSPEWFRWQWNEIDFGTFLADCRRLGRMTLFQG
jgi:DNA-binding transcriptional regulator YhcF (GntR family)